MKKVVLALAGALAATAFAPEAVAIPSFARQTGMACNACHFQHFPMLNSFGRAFKSDGYTLMGSQGKVEDEHVSIPNVLNASLLLKYRYQKTSGNGSAGQGTPGAGQTAPTGSNDGQWQFGDEYSLFFGGRVAEGGLAKIGFLSEFNMAGGSLAGVRLPIVFDAGAVKISAIPFLTDAMGVTYGFELSGGGVQRANRWSEARRETSAVAYNADRGADGGAASGHAFVVHNDQFFVNYTIWSSSIAPGGNGGAIASTNYGQRYIRAAWTPSFSGWDLIVGGGKESGTSYSNTAAMQTESAQTFFDVQAQGEIAGMQTGIYLQNAKAPVCTTAGANCAHNTGSTDRKATTLGANISVMPHVLTVGAAIRKAENGGASGSTGDNATTLSVVYDLYRNVALQGIYSAYSGSAHDGANSGKNMYMFMLEGAW